MGAVISEKPSSAESASIFFADLQNPTQSTRTSKGSEMRDEGVENWDGLKKYLGPKYGPSILTTSIS